MTEIRYWMGKQLLRLTLFVLPKTGRLSFIFMMQHGADAAKKEWFNK